MAEEEAGIIADRTDLREEVQEDIMEKILIKRKDSMKNMTNTTTAVKISAAENQVN